MIDHYCKSGHREHIRFISLAPHPPPSNILITAIRIFILVHLGCTLFSWSTNHFDFHLPALVMALTLDATFLHSPKQPHTYLWCWSCEHGVQGWVASWKKNRGNNNVLVQLTQRVPWRLWTKRDYIICRSQLSSCPLLVHIAYFIFDPALCMACNWHSPKRKPFYIHCPHPVLLLCQSSWCWRVCTVSNNLHMVMCVDVVPAGVHRARHFHVDARATSCACWIAAAVVMQRGASSMGYGWPAIDIVQESVRRC